MKKVFTFLGGSKLFGLDRVGSDTDLVTVYVDFYARLALDNKPKNYTFVEGSETEVEITNVELGTFLKELEDGNLKYAEMVRVSPREVEDLMVYGLVSEFLEVESRPCYPEMYRREIRRRLNKLFFAELNPKAKNFNKEVAFDTKYAAHLYRVIHSACEYSARGVVPITFSSAVKENYFKIRDGLVPRDECFEMLREMSLNAFSVLDEMDDEIAPGPLAQEAYLKVVKSLI